MGTIQQAINQGAQIGAMLYSQSPSAQIRKEEKADQQEIKKLQKVLSKLDEPIGHGFGEMPETNEYDAEKNRALELTEREVYNELANPMNARLYRLTGDPKYAEYMHYNKRAQQISQEQLNTAKYNREMANKGFQHAKDQYDLYSDLRKLRTNEPLFKDFKGGKK